MHHSYIGFDCLSLPTNLSGAGYYIYYLARELLRHTRSHPIAILCTPGRADLFSPYLQSRDKIISIPLKNRIHRLSFYEMGLKKILIDEGIKMFHGTHYLCPPRSENYSIVTTFHDMGFFLHPDYYPISKRLFFTKRMGAFLSRSERIVAISRSTLGAILNLFPEYGARASVIYPGADHLLNETNDPDAHGGYHNPYILAVNSIEKRKNIPFILNAFDTLKSLFGLKHKLVLVGHIANGFKDVLKEIGRARFAADVQLRLSVPLGQLIQYYRNADFFINASSYEGFGFSPLESVNFNLPTFLFRNDIVKEVWGDHPYSFDHWDIGSWTQFINEEMQKGFANKITPETIKRFTWNNTAAKFIELYEQLISASETKPVNKESVVAS
jgi:glycosyltransferase involved in cell wall biosynthesis